MKTHVIILTLLVGGLPFVIGCASVAERVSDVAERGIGGAIESGIPGDASADYDYVPGSRVLFEEDFSSVAEGEFPNGLHFVRGNMEVDILNGRKVLRASGSEGDQFDIRLPEDLPERFTVEFDIHDAETFLGTGIYFVSVPPLDHSYTIHPVEHVRIGNRLGSGVFRGSRPISALASEETGMEDGLVRVEVQVNGHAIRAYANRKQIASVPQVELGRNSMISFQMNHGSANPIYIGNIRVATTE